MMVFYIKYLLFPQINFKLAKVKLGISFKLVGISYQTQPIFFKIIHIHKLGIQYWYELLFINLPNPKEIYLKDF